MADRPPLQVPLTVTDQLGRRVVVAFPPRRIVSLVPSQTELLHELGVGERIVGVTKFCLHPPEVRQRATVVGGTKNVAVDRIATLQPDLIIGNKEENEQAGIEQLAAHYPVWLSDVASLADALDMIRRIGMLTGVAGRAEALATQIAASFAALSPMTAPISVAYFIWRQPYMVAASTTFIDDMLRRAGFTNVFRALDRYPEITPDQLLSAQPQQILLSSEPYPFKEKHLAEFQALCPSARVRIVDGELFSWYGSRLQYSPAYFQMLFSDGL